MVDRQQTIDLVLEIILKIWRSGLSVLKALDINCIKGADCTLLLRSHTQSRRLEYLKNVSIRCLEPDFPSIEIRIYVSYSDDVVINTKTAKTSENPRRSGL